MGLSRNGGGGGGGGHTRRSRALDCACLSFGGISTCRRRDGVVPEEGALLRREALRFSRGGVFQVRAPVRDSRKHCRDRKCLYVETRTFYVNCCPHV